MQVMAAAGLARASPPPLHRLFPPLSPLDFASNLPASTTEAQEVAKKAKGDLAEPPRLLVSGCSPLLSSPLGAIQPRHTRVQLSGRGSSAGEMAVVASWKTWRLQLHAATALPAIHAAASPWEGKQSSGRWRWPRVYLPKATISHPTGAAWEAAQRRPVLSLSLCLLSTSPN